MDKPSEASHVDTRHQIDAYIRGLQYQPRVLLSVQEDGATE